MTDTRHPDLAADTKRPDEAYAWRHVLFILGSIYALLVLGYVVAAYSGEPWAAVLIVPFLGAQIYKTTIIMHDACHYSLFRERALNSWVGTVAGWFVGTPFKNFSRLHWRHHARYGEEDDPQGDDYLHLDGVSRRRLSWHVVRPLLGYNLSKLVQFGRGAGDALAADPGSWRERLKFLAGTCGVQLSLAATASGFFARPWLILLYPISAATFALFCSQTRGFAEHVADPGESPVRHARTHLPNWFDRLFFYTLNFNYHIEHHKYPSVPSCHLPKIHAVMRREPDYGECASSITRTIAHRLSRARVRG